MAFFCIQSLFSNLSQIFSYNSHKNISLLWMCSCVFLFLGENNVSSDSCTLSRAEQDVLAYALYLDTPCHVTTNDCARQQALLDLRKCACVCLKASSTFRMDKKMCVTNTETNSGCTVYSGKTSSEFGTLSTVSQKNSLKLLNLPSRRCNIRYSDSVFLSNGTWSKVISAFPFRLRRTNVLWNDNPNKFTFVHGRIFKLSLTCRRRSYCAIFKVKGNLPFKCVGPVSPPAVHTTVILSTVVTTLATSPLTTGELARSTMIPIGSSRASSSSKPSVHSTISSRRWSSTLGEMPATLKMNFEPWTYQGSRCEMYLQWEYTLYKNLTSDSAPHVTSHSSISNKRRIKSNSPPYLVGVIVGVVLAAICTLLFLVFCCRQRLRNKPESMASSFTSNPTYEVRTETMMVSHHGASFRATGGLIANRGRYMSLRGRYPDRDSYQELIKPERRGSGSKHTPTGETAEENSTNPVYNVLEDITFDKAPPQTRGFAGAANSVSPDYQIYETPGSVLPPSVHERPTSLPCTNQYNSGAKDKETTRTLQSDGYQSPIAISQPGTGSFISASKSGYEIPVDGKVISPVYEEPRQEFSPLNNSCSAEDSKSARRSSLERSQSYEVPVDSVRPEYLEILPSPVSESKEANYQQLGASQNFLYEPLRKENEEKL